MTWECLERHINTSRCEIRTTCIYNLLHLYIVSDSLSEEFVSPVILLAETEAFFMEHEQISMYYGHATIHELKVSFELDSCFCWEDYAC